MIGAVVGWIYNRSVANGPNPDVAAAHGRAVASGLIVGESLFGVLLAGVIVATGNATPFALVGDAFQVYAVPLAAVAFALTIFVLYRWSARLAQRIVT